MMVLINPSASGGRALERWERVERRLRERLGPLTLVVLDGAADASERVGLALQRGEMEFVAAGGDGTVNLLVNLVMERAPADLLARLRIGAVGLGSSNDFHKPFGEDTQIEGVPCRIDLSSTLHHDVGLLSFEEGRALRTRRWIVNASVGITAEGNAFFGRPHALLRWLKRRTTGGAIAYAALHALATHRNRKMSIQVDDEAPFETSVSNIGVVKKPHLSGPFSYGSPYEPASGHFHVHLCENMSRPRLLLTIWKASRSGFSGLPFTRSWRSRRLVVRAARPFAVEIDGEVVHTRCAAFSVQQELLRLCS